MTTPGADWREQLRRLVEGLRPPEADDGASGTHCDYGWCPLCQAAAVLRGERPEVSAALADILATASAALRQFAGESPAAGPREETPEDPPPAPPVQRIDLT